MVLRIKPAVTSSREGFEKSISKTFKAFDDRFRVLTSMAGLPIARNIASAFDQSWFP